MLLLQHGFFERNTDQNLLYANPLSGLITLIPRGVYSMPVHTLYASKRSSRTSSPTFESRDNGNVKVTN
jgi:hypothetical protein